MHDCTAQRHRRKHATVYVVTACQSRVDYCGSLFVGTPKKTTDKLQRVLNAAVRLVSNTRKYDRGLTHIIRRNVLHWLDVTDRIRFRVCVQMFKCLHGMAPDYLSTMCHPASRLSGRQNLRSANRGQLDVPRATLSSCGVRAFAHPGPSLWNTLPVHLKNRNLTLQLSCAILSLIFFLVLISY